MDIPDWNKWSVKFEKLLSRMHWRHATAIVDPFIGKTMQRIWITQTNYEKKKNNLPLNHKYPDLTTAWIRKDVTIPNISGIECFGPQADILKD